MLIIPIVAALLSSVTATPAELGNCVRDKAVELSSIRKPAKSLAPVAIERCKDIFEKLVVARDATAAKDGERASSRPANSRAYRQSLNKLLTQLAITTIDERRRAR
ncbi:MAG: hypothetical protein V4472_08660 [Pseudomonadota bacterium]